MKTIFKSLLVAGVIAGVGMGISFANEQGFCKRDVQEMRDIFSLRLQKQNISRSERDRLHKWWGVCDSILRGNYDGKVDVGLLVEAIREQAANVVRAITNSPTQDGGFFDQRSQCKSPRRDRRRNFSQTKTRRRGCGLRKNKKTRNRNEELFGRSGRASSR